MTIGDQPTQTVGEPDDLAKIPAPVPGVQPGAVDRLAGDGRDHRDRRWAWPEPGQLPLQLDPDRVHLGAVKRDLAIKDPGENAEIPEVRDQVGDGLGLARDRGRGRPVDRRESEPTPGALDSPGGGFG